jgi:hypothetical protein
MGEVRSISSKYINQGHFMPKRQRVKIFLTGVKPNWPRLNSFCLIAGIKTGSKKSIWIFKYN